MIFQHKAMAAMIAMLAVFTPVCISCQMPVLAEELANASDPDLTPAEHFAMARAARAEGAERAAAGDTQGAIAKMTEALSHQTGHASILVNLAVLSDRLGDVDAVRNWLERIDALGLAFPAETLAGALPGSAEQLAELIASIDENGAATGEAQKILSINAADMLIESVAVLDDDWYVSGIAEPGLYRTGEDGTPMRLGDETDRVGSVFELVADPARRLIWFATATVAQTPDDYEGLPSAVIGYNVDDGTIRYRFTAPEADAAITDIAVTPDTVYFTDQENGGVYAASPNDGTVKTLVPAGHFGTLQGLAISNGRLYASDYATGLHAIDVANGKTTPLRTSKTALLGIDGLSADGARGLIAIRNGARPHGVFHIDLSTDGMTIESVRVLASGLPEFDDPTLGFVDGSHFYFIANSQWPSFPEDGSRPDTPRKPVHVMAVPLD